MKLKKLQLAIAIGLAFSCSAYAIDHASDTSTVELNRGGGIFPTKPDTKLNRGGGIFPKKPVKINRGGGIFPKKPDKKEA